MLQGARWTGEARLQGADAGDYQLETYTWTFPAGAVKGFGTFAEFAERPGTNDPGSDWLFTGYPTGRQGNAVAMTDPEAKYSHLKFTDDDKSFQSNLPSHQSREVNDHVIDSFSWGPDAGAIDEGAEETVSVSATYVKVLNNKVVDRSTDTDSVTFNVIRPTGKIVVPEMGRAA